MASTSKAARAVGRYANVSVRVTPRETEDDSLYFSLHLVVQSLEDFDCDYFDRQLEKIEECVVTELILRVSFF